MAGLNLPATSERGKMSLLVGLDGRKLETTPGITYSRGNAAKRHTTFLQTYDKDLIAKWVWQSQRWSVWTKDKKNRWYLVFIVQNEDGSYRDIDQRTLLDIKKADLYRKERAYSILKEIEENNSNIEVAQGKKLHDAVVAISKERWRFTVSNPLSQAGMSFKKEVEK